MREKYDDVSTSFMVNTIGVYLMEGVEASLTEILKMRRSISQLLGDNIFERDLRPLDIKRTQVSPMVLNFNRICAQIVRVYGVVNARPLQ